MTGFAFGGKSLSEGKFADAISTYKEVLGLSPNNLDAYLGLARAFFKKGDLLSALDAARKAATINPTSREVDSLFQEFRIR